MKKLVIGSLIAALASPVAQASNWKYLGEGTLNEAGTEFGYYVDSDSLQHLKALRGVWLNMTFTSCRFTC